MTPEELEQKEKELNLREREAALKEKGILQNPKPTTINEPTSEKITKRTAAIEVIGIHKQKITTAIIAMAGGFVTAITMTFNTGVGATVAGIICIGAGFLLLQSKREITRLATAYNINLKAK